MRKAAFNLVPFLAAVAGLAFIGLAVAALLSEESGPAPAPAPPLVPAPLDPPPSPPVPPRRPRPCPGPGPCPLATVVPLGKLSVGGPVAPDGNTQVQCDLPLSLRKKNRGGTDGAGLCVWTSIGHSAAFQNERALVDLQAFAARQTGGGWPDRVDEYLPALAKEKGAPTPGYLQYEGRDPSILLAALASGRMPAVTYDGRDPHYGRQRVAHMVNLVYLDGAQAAVLDNNYVGEQELVWMSAQDFLERWTGGRQGWAVVLLSPAPAPVPLPLPPEREG